MAARASSLAAFLLFLISMVFLALCSTTSSWNVPFGSSSTVAAMAVLYGAPVVLASHVSRILTAWFSRPSLSLVFPCVGYLWNSSGCRGRACTHPALDPWMLGH